MTWPTRDELYEESTGYHLDMIEDFQKTIDTQRKRIAELESRNAYLQGQAIEQTVLIESLNADIDYWRSYR